jgi:hypothetical protein
MFGPLFFASYSLLFFPSLFLHFPPGKKIFTSHLQALISAISLTSVTNPPMCPRSSLTSSSCNTFSKNNDRIQRTLSLHYPRDRVATEWPSQCHLRFPRHKSAQRQRQLPRDTTHPKRAIVPPPDSSPPLLPQRRRQGRLRVQLYAWRHICHHRQ